MKDGLTLGEFQDLMCNKNGLSFEEFKTVIKGHVDKGIIHNDNGDKLSDFDIAVMFAIIRIQSRKGDECTIDMDEIEKEVLSFAPEIANGFDEYQDDEEVMPWMEFLDNDDDIEGLYEYHGGDI